MRTTWRILSLRDDSGLPHTGIGVTLSVDTDSPDVLVAIEKAAEHQGIVLQRDLPDPPGAGWQE